jgi:hypothetical protein
MGDSHLYRRGKANNEKKRLWQVILTEEQWFLILKNKAMKYFTA